MDLDPVDEALGRLESERESARAGSDPAQWAQDQAHLLVQRYVRSLRQGSVEPLRVIAPTFTREDWTDKSGGIFSRRSEQRHRWLRSDQTEGTAWLVRAADTWATIEKGAFIPGDGAFEPDTDAPVVIIYEPNQDTMRLAVLMRTRALRRLGMGGAAFEEIRDAKEATVAPQFNGLKCDYLSTGPLTSWMCKGTCGYPLWADRIEQSVQTYLGARGSAYEELPHGGFREVTLPTGTGATAFDFHVGGLLKTLDAQLREQGLTWSE